MIAFSFQKKKNEINNSSTDLFMVSISSIVKLVNSAIS